MADQSLSRSVGAGVHNKVLPHLQAIFDPREMHRSLDAYVFEPFGPPLIGAGKGALDVLTADGKVPAGIGPLYTGLTGLGEFSEGVLYGDKTPGRNQTPSGGGDPGYKPGLYAPGPMSTNADEPIPPAVSPEAPNPYDATGAFLPGPPPIAAGGVAAPPMRPVPAPFDPASFPAAPQRAPINQNIDPYFAEEEQALEAARPAEPKFDNTTLILRALTGAAIGAAAGGDIGAAFAGGLTGLTTGMERRETQKEKYERELEAYHLRRAGLSSRKGMQKAEIAEKQSDVDYNNASTAYQRAIEIERLKRSQDDKIDDVIWQNRKATYDYQNELAKVAVENAKAMQPKYSMADGVLYMQQYRKPENGKPGGMEVLQMPLDPLLHDIERRAKIAKGIETITGTSKEQSIALVPSEIKLPPEKKYVGDAVLVGEMNNAPKTQAAKRAAEISVLYELNRLPKEFFSLTPEKQDEYIRQGKNSVIQETGDIKQFDDTVTRLYRQKMVEYYWQNEVEGRAAASERMR